MEIGKALIPVVRYIHAGKKEVLYLSMYAFLIVKKVAWVGGSNLIRGSSFFL